MGSPTDTDGDTIPDDCDLCPGFDDLVDTDLDTVADGCDVCPIDAAEMCSFAPRITTPSAFLSTTRT